MFSFEASQIAQKYLQLPLMVNCSAVNTPFLVHQGNYVGCQEHIVGRLSTPGSPVIFRPFEHISLSRKQPFGGSNSISSPSLLFFLILVSMVFRAPFDQTSHLSLLSSRPHILPETVNIYKDWFSSGSVPAIIISSRYWVRLGAG